MADAKLSRGSKCGGCAIVLSFLLSLTFKFLGRELPFAEGATVTLTHQSNNIDISPWPPCHSVYRVPKTIMTSIIRTNNNSTADTRMERQLELSQK